MLYASSQHLTDALNQTLVLVLAGGKGSRLKELTLNRAKPAVEFGGHARLIDFTLSNCVNSGLKQVAVLTQYKAQCLIQHLMKTWSPLNLSFGGRLDVLPSSPAAFKPGYVGTADACFQNIDYIKSVNPKYVLVLSGDHVYNMDYRALLRTHLNQDAEMTISCIETPVIKAANQFGVMTVNGQNRITGFDEKPTEPNSLEDVPGYCLASMGVYAFNAEFLLEQLSVDAERAHSEHDFGKSVIPNILKSHSVMAHRFRDMNGDKVPYWRDVGTLDSYWQAHMDLIEGHHGLSLSDPDWPIWGQQLFAAPSTISSIPENHINRVLLSAGCQLLGCRVEDALLSVGCTLQQQSEIQQSVLLPGVTVGKGAKIKRAIVDRDCNIPAEFRIENADEAKALGMTVSDNGVALITQCALNKLALHPQTIKSQLTHQPHTGLIQQQRAAPDSSLLMSSLSM